MKNFNGKALFLDRNDINTDEIIPAKYLTEVDKKALKPYLLEDLKLDGFSPDMIEGKRAVITKSNFGCGSSREHAPWAFEVNGINIVIGISFARIFRQNMFNCGMLAIELPDGDIEDIFREYAKTGAEVSTDLAKQTIKFYSDNKSKVCSFTISGFNKDLVASGGWVNYADTKY
ncbi:MAG: 3-isopropylmalate dehydratase small subunit [Spirochaetia bacterium]|jgi:3-isopropylmalate/(R)-2-methylmalate dehydratase small subunit|nr:3-isopropylmalate dehydratase small subunit [Spirochaetia bacterium]